jgi:hypothetical protein
MEDDEKAAEFSRLLKRVRVEDRAAIAALPFEFRKGFVAANAAAKARLCREVAPFSESDLCGRRARLVRLAAHKPPSSDAIPASLVSPRLRPSIIEWVYNSPSPTFAVSPAELDGRCATSSTGRDFSFPRKISRPALQPTLPLQCICLRLAKAHRATQNCRAIVGPA